MIIKVYDNTTNDREIDKIVNLLKGGGVIAYPTDSVYAIGCDALNVRAAERICKYKGINPLKSNLSIIGGNLSDLSRYVKINDFYFKLIKRNTPGEFTFILPTASGLPKLYKNRKCVGIRIPNNTFVRDLADALGNPILTSSLHSDSDIGYYTNPELIEELHNNFVELIIDGGIGGTTPSTVVDCTGDEPKIIRDGGGDLEF